MDDLEWLFLLALYLLKFGLSPPTLTKYTKHISNQELVDVIGELFLPADFQQVHRVAVLRRHRRKRVYDLEQLRININVEVLPAGKILVPLADALRDKLLEGLPNDGVA